MSDYSQFFGIRKYEEFTSSGTWTRPAGVDVVEYLVVAAGGGAEGGDTSARRLGGGGGQLQKGALGVTGNLTVTIGSGGAGGSAAAGSNGGNTTLTGGLFNITAAGGGGGDATVVDEGFAGGGREATNGNNLRATVAGDGASFANNGITGCGGFTQQTVKCPASGGIEGQLTDNITSTNPFVGGASSFKNGGAPNTSGTGTAGTANGGGGGGGGNTVGGAGADGYVLLTWFE